MGMCAQVLAIGKFKRSIANYLEYPEEFYKDTKDGAVVALHLFGILEGSTLSRQFAGLLGITDPWDFNQHKLNPENFDKDGLIEFINFYKEYKEDLGKFLLLIGEGFEFYFLPNG